MKFTPGDVVVHATDPHSGLRGIFLGPNLDRPGLSIVLWDSGMTEQIVEDELRPFEGEVPDPRPAILHGRHRTGMAYRTGSNQILVNVHRETDDCRTHGCVIHNPSPEAVAIGPTYWRDDRNMMERICEHGVGHPDPDAQAWRERTFGSRDDLHSCDGCCKAA